MIEGLRNVFIETLRIRNQSIYRYGIKDEVPYKFRDYAYLFFDDFEIKRRRIFKKGTYSIETYISKPNTGNFLKTIGESIIHYHGIRKFTSSLLQAVHYGDWSRRSERKIRTSYKKLGNTRYYREQTINVYALEEELNETLKELKSLISQGTISDHNNNRLQYLEAKKESLETHLTEEIKTATDEELLARARRWMKSLD